MAPRLSESDIQIVSLEVAERCVESSFRRAFSEITDEERAKVYSLGFSNDALMAESLEATNALAASEAATREVAEDVGEADDALVIILPRIATRHLLDEAMQRFLKSKISGVAA